MKIEKRKKKKKKKKNHRRRVPSKKVTRTKKQKSLTTVKIPPWGNLPYPKERQEDGDLSPPPMEINRSLAQKLSGERLRSVKKRWTFRRKHGGGGVPQWIVHLTLGWGGGNVQVLRVTRRHQRGRSIGCTNLREPRREKKNAVPSGLPETGRGNRKDTLERHTKKEQEGRSKGIEPIRGNRRCCRTNASWVWSLGTRKRKDAGD